VSKRPPPPVPTPEEIAAAALNRQGFLFSQATRERIKLSSSGNVWEIMAGEFPVTATDGSQTRIDLLLRNRREQGKYICVECKRAHPKYKRWIFFDRVANRGGTAQPEAFFESFRIFMRSSGQETNAIHQLESFLIEPACPVFNLYLEVAVNLDGQPGYTETIEEAFIQVTKGQSGLVAKYIGFDQGFWRCVAFPVVVTSAEISEVGFDITKVSPNLGTIDAKDITLSSLDFCAVNYHSNDNMALASKFASKSVSIDHEVRFANTHTVFVVQAGALDRFLHWIDTRVAVSA
jgi:hypothetical protein